MNAEELVRLLTEIPFVVIFVVVLVVAMRRPTRVHRDIVLVFGVLAAAVAAGWVNRLLPGEPPEVVGDVTATAVVALPYLLLRILDDFAGVRRRVLRAAEAGLVAVAAALFAVSGEPIPPTVLLPLVVYFVALQAYVAYRFVQAARQVRGVTQRRMQAAAAGSALLGSVILIAGVSAVAPGEDVWTALSRVAGLASGIAYVVAFAPPAFLRHAWQEPELRRFLVRASELPRLPDLESMVAALEAGAASSVGVGRAAVLLWEEREARLVSPTMPTAPAPPDGIVMQAFASQRPVFVEDTARKYPEYRDVYERADARAIVAAPITAGDRRLGVLSLYAARAPLFADEDIELIELLADQAAVVIESRALIDEAARVRAREEATRLKDDFLSAAAHDLKTPLTTLLGQAQLLERRTLRQPDAPADPEGLRRLVREASRMRTLVNDLLDASRADQGRLSGDLRPVDLAAIAREAASSLESPHHSVVVEADGLVPVLADPSRLSQVFENLLDNAVKYSPAGGEVRVAVARTADEARVAVLDGGIGIPREELSQLFQRFWRGQLASDRRFAGMGLGLYLCRRITEEHGGRIWAESVEGEGSTFHVALPLAQQEDAP